MVVSILKKNCLFFNVNKTNNSIKCSPLPVAYLVPQLVKHHTSEFLLCLVTSMSLLTTTASVCVCVCARVRERWIETGQSLVCLLLIFLVFNCFFTLSSIHSVFTTFHEILCTLSSRVCVYAYNFFLLFHVYTLILWNNFPVYIFFLNIYF